MSWRQAPCASGGHGRTTHRLADEVGGWLGDASRAVGAEAQDGVVWHRDDEVYAEAEDLPCTLRAELAQLAMGAGSKARLWSRAVGMWEMC